MQLEVSAHLVPWASQGVVGVETEQRAAEVAHTRVGRQGDIEPGRVPPSTGVLVEDVGHRGRADGAAAERVLDGSLHPGGGVEVEEGEARDLAARVLATLRKGLGEGVGIGAGGSEAVAPAKLAGAPPLASQRLDASEVLDHLPLVVAAWMGGDDGAAAVGDPDDRPGGDPGERVAGQVVADG
ncbi:MAG: hypothetical protein IPQ24_12745 [Anaeromyxobacter sp.]|nr:hypothetical protein [Anaeromyxobacter sp.]